MVSEELGSRHFWIIGSGVGRVGKRERIVEGLSLLDCLGNGDCDDDDDDDGDC